MKSGFILRWTASSTLTALLTVYMPVALILHKHRWQGGQGLSMETPCAAFRSGYLVFYRPTSFGIEVVRILSGKRDLDELLK